MRIEDYCVFFYSTTNQPPGRRRVRIDGRLKGTGDTVYIPRLGINGTIVNIHPLRDPLTHLSVIAHSFGHYTEGYPIEDLREGSGISDFHRAWLNGLEIYFWDPIILPDPPIDE